MSVNEGEGTPAPGPCSAARRKIPGRSLAALLLSWLLAISAADAGAGESSLVFERLDGSKVTAGQLETEIPDILSRARLPGLQIAIVQDGRVAFTHGYGVKNTSTGEPVGRETVFAAHSFSKTMFAYIVLQLVDEGALDLDEPLVSYLPKPLPSFENYRDLEGDDLHKVLTARMALSHTTGFPNWRFLTSEGKLMFLFEPGTRFSYSGEGIFLLQLVVEEITGKGLEELAQARIFGPLGLERTSYLSLPEFREDFATDHDHFLEPLGKQIREEANAAGSAQTTAANYAEFLCAVMEGTGLSAESRSALLTPQVRIEHERMFGPRAWVTRAPGNESRASWGLGWGLFESDHGRALFHTGNDRGAANYHVAYPDRGLGVVLLGNSQTLEAAAPALTRLIIGDTASPFEYLGYEPFDSPRHRLSEIVVGRGLDAGLEYFTSLEEAELERWYPDRMWFLHMAGRELLGLGRPKEAAAFYGHFLKENPDWSIGYEHLAVACIDLDDLVSARDAYREGLARSKSGSTEEVQFRWRLEWVEALLEPMEVPLERLEAYAGNYETRHVDLRDGTLYYYREGTPDPEPKRLYALSVNTFVMKEADFFRMRFERNLDGKVMRIRGLYMGGREDESPRDEAR